MVFDSSGPGAGLSRPAATQRPVSPFTNSLAALRAQPVLRHVCSRLCPPASHPRPHPCRSWVTAGECLPPFTLCFQAQLSCPLPASPVSGLSCPLTLPSLIVLGKYIPLGLQPTPLWVAALLSRLPLSGGRSVSSLSLCCSSRPLGGLVLIQLVGLHRAGPAPAFMCVFPCSISCPRSAPTSLLLLTFPSLLPLGLFPPRLQCVRWSAVAEELSCPDAGGWTG